MRERYRCGGRDIQGIDISRDRNPDSAVDGVECRR
jgi:hypothetical protein